MNQNEVQAMEGVAEATVRSGLTGNKKWLVFALAILATGGFAAAGYAIYRGVTSRKAKKASEQSVVEETHE